jgi:hypothetical protein
MEAEKRGQNVCDRIHSESGRNSININIKKDEK